MKGLKINKKGKLHSTDNLVSWLMLSPMLIIFTLFFIVPLLLTFGYSFTDWSNYFPEISFIGIKNYLNVFTDKTLLSSLEHSLTYAFFTVLLQNVIALPVAIVLTSKTPGKNLFRTLFFAPTVLSSLVVGYLFSFILSSDDYGLMNYFLGFFGLARVNFLGDSYIALASVIATQVWQWFGWSMVIYIANLQGIPQEYYEAASLDGASSWQKFIHITLPNLSPSLKINCVTGLISGLKVFDIVFSLTSGGPGHATDTILMELFNSFSDGNYGYAAAFGIIFLLITMLLTTLVMKIFKKWEAKLN